MIDVCTAVFVESSDCSNSWGLWPRLWFLLGSPQSVGARRLRRVASYDAPGLALCSLPFTVRELFIGLLKLSLHSNYVRECLLGF